MCESNVELIQHAGSFWRTHMATVYWHGISHAHSREDSLLGHTVLRINSLTASYLQGQYCCSCLHKKGMPERLSRSHVWPKHESQYYLRFVKTEGCLCLMLLG